MKVVKVVVESGRPGESVEDPQQIIVGYSPVPSMN